MPTVRLDTIAIRSIIKFELQQAPKHLPATAQGKARMEWDRALSILADRIAAHVRNHTISARVSANPIGSHIPVASSPEGTP